MAAADGTMRQLRTGRLVTLRGGPEHASGLSNLRGLAAQELFRVGPGGSNSVPLGLRQFRYRTM